MATATDEKPAAKAQIRDWATLTQEYPEVLKIQTVDEWNIWWEAHRGVAPYYLFDRRDTVEIARPPEDTKKEKQKEKKKEKHIGHAHDLPHEETTTEEKPAPSPNIPPSKTEQEDAPVEKVDREAETNLQLTQQDPPIAKESEEERLLAESIKNGVAPLSLELPSTELQQDHEFAIIKNKLMKQKQDEWEKNNPTKNWTNRVDDKTYLPYFTETNHQANGKTSPLLDDAEMLFRQQHADKAATYDKKEAERIYDTPLFDPVYNQFLEQRTNAFADAINTAKKEGKAQTPEQINAIAKPIDYRYSYAFTTQFPKKAFYYAERDPGLRVSTTYTRRKAAEKNPAATSPILPPLAGQTAAPVVQIRKPLPPAHAQGEDEEEIGIEIAMPPQLPAEGPGEPPEEEEEENRDQQQQAQVRQQQNLLQRARQLRQMGKNLARVARAVRTLSWVARAIAFLMTPPGWVTIGIAAVILLILLIVLLFGGGSGSGTGEPGSSKTVPGLTWTMEGPDQIANGETATYTIKGTYAGSGEVIITNPIPDNADRVDEKGQLLSRDPVTWSVKGDTSAPSAQQASSFPLELYLSYGFPKPSTNLPTMSASEQRDWETYAKPAAQKAAQAMGIDVGLLGMWAWIETKFSSYASNCRNETYNDQNYYCSGGAWQVGYGVQFYDRLDDLPEAFTAMHPGEKVQAVGQKIIDEAKNRSPRRDAITQPSPTFPDVSIDQLTQEAKKGDRNARLYAAMLMKDDTIGMYLIAKTFKGVVGPSLSKTMEGWDTKGGYYQPQKIVDHIAAIYGSGAVGNAGKNFSFSITLKPKSDDIILVNKAFPGLVGSGMIEGNSASLKETFREAARSRKIPVALLMAIAKTESGVHSYTEDEVQQFNQTNWFSGKPDDAPTLELLDPLIRRGYAYNTCAFPKSNPICPRNDVRGAMQFELNTWNSYKSKLQFADGHDPDRRYVRDIIYGAAQLIRDTADQYNNRFRFNDSLDWNEQQVRAMARRYCGGNPDADTSVAACSAGGTPHDTLTWTHYQEFRRQETQEQIQ